MAAGPASGLSYLSSRRNPFPRGPRRARRCRHGSTATRSIIPCRWTPAPRPGAGALRPRFAFLPVPSAAHGINDQSIRGRTMQPPPRGAFPRAAASGVRILPPRVTDGVAGWLPGLARPPSSSFIWFVFKYFLINKYYFFSHIISQQYI